MIINHYLTEFVLSCVFRKVIYREQQDSPFHYVFQKYFVSLQPVPWYKKQPANFDSGGYSETWLRTLIAEA